MAKSPLSVRRPSTLSAYKPSLREQAAILGEKGFKALTGREPGYEARENINRYTGLLDLLEVPGAVLSANEAARNIKSKQYGAAAGDIAGLAAGAIPIAGGALKKGAKKVVEEGVEGVSRLLTKYPEARSIRPSEVAIDPRIEERKGELGKISVLKVHETPRQMEPTPEVSIFDMEGRPYITSMSDLSAAGKDIVGVNDVPLRDPFSLRGGQDWMFDNPGSVWASERKPAQKHVDLAKSLKDLTGKDPLFLPWTMGPNSVTFSHMPRGLQYEYANAAMDASDKAALASDIKSILPNWGGFEDPRSAKMFMSAEGSDRNALNKLMDKYRTRGGLGEGEAIYATTDLDQIGAPLTSLRNVGVITPEREVGVSTHPSYSGSVPGYGLGRLKEKNIGALALAPDVMREANLTDPFGFPVGVVPGVKSPMRAYQMGPKGGVLDYETLRFIEKTLAKGKKP